MIRQEEIVEDYHKINYFIKFPRQRRQVYKSKFLNCVSNIVYCVLIGAATGGQQLSATANQFVDKIDPFSKRGNSRRRRKLVSSSRFIQLPYR